MLQAQEMVLAYADAGTYGFDTRDAPVGQACTGDLMASLLYTPPVVALSDAWTPGAPAVVSGWSVVAMSESGPPTLLSDAEAMALVIGGDCDPGERGYR